MITKEKIKQEIDYLSDEHLEVLYRIIKALEMPAEEIARDRGKADRISEWLAFIDETYGSLAEAPIERGDQGEYEVREVTG